ncbi:MAG: hypothetical protein H0T79_14610, partial [Deltaproteobacteria bacterium]|nr:hypothetical protein [Deltaproteobacteria bacterium]
MSTRPSLDFTRDAARLVVGSTTGVHIVTINGRQPAVEVPLPGVDEVLTVGDEVWAVVGEQLHRLTTTGDRVGTPITLPPGPGRLVRTSGRELAAVWSAAPASMLLAEGDGVAISTLPGDPDCVVPVSSARWLLCQRDRITLREASSVRWSTSIGGREDRVLDGSILFDGRSVALLVEQAGEANARQLVILGLREPIVQHRMTLAGVDSLRFASLRGFALLRAARRLLLVDLRFGRVVKEHDAEGDVADLAIDDSAQHIALRYHDHNEMILLDVRALLASPTRPKVIDESTPSAGDPVIETAAAPAIDPEPPAVAFHLGQVPLGSVVALVPRPVIQPTARGEAIALLERYRTLALALVGRSIAYAWDQGRLAFPTDGGLPFRTEVAGLLGRTEGLARADVQEAEQT